MDSYTSILKRANEGLDRIIDERDAALSRLGALETACIEARRWIEHNDDLSDNDAERVLKLIRNALAAAKED